MAARAGAGTPGVRPAGGSEGPGRGASAPRTPARVGARPWLWVLPALALLLFFWGFPTLWTLGLSLTDASMAGGPSALVGWANYARALGDPLFFTALKNSAVLLTCSVLLEVSLGLGVALCLHGARSRAWRPLLAVVLLLPWLFSELVSAVAWRWVLQEPFGLLNGLLRQAGLPAVAWLGRPGTAMAALVTASLWKGIGISTFVILAALRGIPARILDAAALDGAVGWRGLKHVILPQIRGVLLLDGLLVAIKSLGSFTLVFALTGGGPGHGTEILATYLYRLAFFHHEAGYASAVGVLLAVLFLLLVSLVFLHTREPGRAAREGAS